ncbi:MAG: hypothetical protein VYA30_08080 [Myxococcota bacterium]|nr:hypothetical protein [Myxococcota bacterium]
MYSHSLYVLTNQPFSVDQVAAQLQRMRLHERVIPPPREHWSRMAPGFSLLVPGDESAKLFVDSVSEPWPSGQMLAQQRSISVAFRMGFFGPSIRPDCFHRALHSADEELQARLMHHTGFVRLRMAQTKNLDNDAKSKSAERLHALAYMLRAANFILEHDAAVGLFVPTAQQFFSPKESWRRFDAAMGNYDKLWPIWVKTALETESSGKSCLVSWGLNELGTQDVRLYDARSDEEAMRAAFDRYVIAGLRHGHLETDHRTLASLNLSLVSVASAPVDYGIPRIHLLTQQD